MLAHNDVFCILFALAKDPSVSGQFHCLIIVRTVSYNYNL